MKQTLSFPRKVFSLVQRLMPQKRRRRILRGLDILILGVLLTIIIALLIAHLFFPGKPDTQPGKHGGYVALASHTTISRKNDRQDRQQRVSKDQDPLGTFIATNLPTEGLVIQNPIFMKVWQASLAINDALLVIMFLIAGYSVMAGAAGFRYADAVETLPRIFLAALAAHASLVICTTFVGLENAATTQLYHSVGSIVFNHPTTFLGVLGQIVGATFGNITNAITGQSILDVILQIGMFFMMITINIQFIIRVFLLSLLGAISPLGLGAWGLPQGSGQQLTRLWFSSFFAVVIVQFLQVAGYVLAQGFINWFLNVYLFKTGGNDFLGGLTTSFVNSQQVVTDILQIAVLWFVIRIPGLVQSAATGIMMDGAQNTSGALQSAVTTVVQTVTSVAQTAAGVATAFI